MTPWNKNKTNVFSKETLLKMSKSHVGQKAWNKGLKMNKPVWNKGIKTGKPAWNTGLKTGKPAWNKGISGDEYLTSEARAKMSNAKKGKKLSEEHIEKITVSVKNARGGKRNITTSDYKKIHYWIFKNFGKASKCEFCKTSNKSKYEWSNISQEYKYDINDWQQLCVKCHSIYDQNYKKGII